MATQRQLTMIICYIFWLLHLTSHPQLDWMKVKARTCPFENDMEQRLAKFAELMYLVSNNIPYGVTRDEFNSQLTDYLFYDQAAIFAVIFPDTIKQSQSYFTYTAFQANQLDLSKHSSWYSLNALLNGKGLNDPTPTEFYGNPSNISFYDYLQQLPFSIKIVHGISYYYCDDEHSWGFNQANIYIKEKITNPWVNIMASLAEEPTDSKHT